MPRYAHQKPVNRLYSYNLKYMNNYYKPMTHYLEKSEKAPSELPGHQSLAERLKTFPMDGSVYKQRATSAPPSHRGYDVEADSYPKPCKVSEAGTPCRAASQAPSLGRRARGFARPLSSYDQSPGEEVSDADQMRTPLWMKHPYRLPVEDVSVPPHESSIWPSTVPHFNLVSSYDAMVGYLGLKYPVIG